jgi:hypothetical protein
MLVLATLAGLILMRPARAQSETAPTEGSSGAPSGSQELSFGAGLSAQASYRQDLDLAPDGDPGTSTRLQGDMVWTLRTPTASMFASLNPYVEYFPEDSSRSTYGGTAGLGFEQRRGPIWSWGLRARVQAAPEQDVAPPQTSDTPDPPTVQPLVPRNGYIYGALDLNTSFEVSGRSSLSFSGFLSTRRYDVYQVQDDRTTTALVDRRQYGLGARWAVQTAPRNTWSLNFSANQNQMNDPTREEGLDEKPQASLNVGFSRVISLHQTFSVASGMSTIDTGDGITVSTPTLGLLWGYTHQSWNASATVQHSQGIFPSSNTAVNFTAVAGRWGWSRGRNSVGTHIGYAVSSDAGEGDLAVTGTEGANLGGGYSRSSRRLTWGLNLFYNRQFSDADYAGDLQSARVFASLGWRLAGRDVSSSGGSGPRQSAPSGGRSL